MANTKQKCQAILDGKRCARVAAFRHRNAVGSASRKVVTFVNLCRSCSRWFDGLNATIAARGGFETEER